MARTSNIRSAKRLLRAAEPSTSTDPPYDHVAAAGRLLGVLFDALGPVIGAAGVAATFVRSVRLSKTAHPGLELLLAVGRERQPDQGELAALLEQCLGGLDAASAASLAVDLYGTFFDLMSNFIGDDLLWQIVKRPPEMDENGSEETD